jgi:hypothetical protein
MMWARSVMRSSSALHKRRWVLKVYAKQHAGMGGCGSRHFFTTLRRSFCWRAFMLFSDKLRRVWTE